MEKETSGKVELSEHPTEISNQSVSVDGSTPEAPRDSMNLRGRIQSTFRLFRNKLSFVGLDSEDETKLREEVGYLERQATVDGVNFSRIQIEKVLSDRDIGRKIEFETLSQYLCDYNMKTGEIWEDRLTPADKIGLRLGKTLRDIFPKACLISLWDAYNTSMPDSSDERGIPLSDGKQIVIPEGVQETFKNNSIELQKKAGGISENSVDGTDYQYISESSKVADAEILVSRLESAGYIERIQDPTNNEREEINFINPNAENPTYRKINLKTKNGRWLCEALDASSYIKPENLDITHIVVLPNSFKEQQDKVWEMLKCLGIEPLNYHNIFYDESKDPEEVERIVKEEFAKYERSSNPDWG
jgi:hypothetical protein